MKRKRSKSASSVGGEAKSKQKVTGLVGENVFQCGDESLRVMLMFPGESRCLYGVARVFCIAGEIRVDGYEMRSTTFDRTKMVQICAPHRMKRPALIESTFVNDPLGVLYKHSRLKYRLKELTPHYESIMSVIGEKQPAVVIVDRQTPLVPEVVDHMVSEMLIPSKLRSACFFDRSYIYPVDNWQLYDERSRADLDKFMTKISNKRKEGSKCVVMPCAGKGSGKSTLVRHIVNRNLSQDDPPVYLMDVDVGQSEFTPAGCVSLWKITEPMLAVPWAHQSRVFVCSYFYGSIHVADDCQKYTDLCDILYARFTDISEPGSLLVINTMGWIEGTGAIILNHLCHLTRPAAIFTMPGLRGVFTPPSIVPRVIHVEPEHQPGGYIPEPIRTMGGCPQMRQLRPAELRDITMTAYFACLVPRPILSSISDVAPYTIPFSKAIFAVPEDYTYVQDEHFFGTINSQIVALCIADDSENQKDAKPLEMRRLLGRDYLPQMINIGPTTPPLRCLGYGLIRAIDVERQKMFLHTPLPADELSRTSIMARGTDINIPLQLLRCQTAAQVPYLSQPPKTATSDSGGKIIADLYGSLKVNAKHQRGFYPQTK